MKKIVVLALLTLLCACSKKTKTEKPPAPVVVAEVIAKDVPLYIDAPGHIEAYNTIDLKSQVTGTVTGVYYTQGKEVGAGDVLVTIDKRPFVAALHQAEAGLAQSLASLRYAQDTARRNTPLVQEEYVSQDYYDNLVTNVMVDEASVKQNQAEVETAEINLSYCTISANMDAITGERLVDVGNLVLEDGSTTLVTLNQIKPIYCSFFISERNFPSVQKHLKGNTLDVLVAYKNDFKETWKGEVTFLDNAVDTTTGMIKMKATFPNEDKMLWPGIFVYTRLILETIDDALLMPTSAIQHGEKGKFVYLLEQDSTVKQTYISTGQQQDTEIVVTKGLKKGDKVVTQGQLNLYDGVKVSVKKKESKS